MLPVLRPVTLAAAAKVNLSLRVLGRRADGFHEVETLMVPLALADEVSLGVGERPGIECVCDDPSLPADSGNLAVRAAESFYARLGVSPQLRLGLQKRVPHGAGLGGGSSDAATVLLGLNEFHRAGMSVDVLTELAAALGSDVPFFLRRGPAVCRGRGERVEPAAAFDAPLPLLLLKPPFGVPTPWAYGRWRDSQEIPGVPYAAQAFPWGELVNDLERPVFEKFFVLAAMKTWLLAQPEVAGALLSGSGATVLAVLRSGDEPADALVTRARETFGPDLWTCRTATAATAVTAADVRPNP